MDGAGAGGMKKSLVVGPWGGNGGNRWDDGIFTGVREIKLVYHLCIDSVRVVYDQNGKPYTAEQHGAYGGSKTAEIKLQYPDEFLTSVSGHYGPLDAWRGGDPYIRSLAFKSNRRTFGPYGVQEGTPFTFSSDSSQAIVGFYGQSRWYLDSIGLHLTHAKSRNLLPKEVVTGRPEKSLVVGPWGGNGGTSWDDGTFTGVREITLVYNRCIDSILVVYDRQGQPFQSEKHGGTGGNKTAVIKLQYPDEFLISVSGHYAPLEAWQSGHPYIRSLTFKSNRRTFGPYGVEEGTQFTYSSNPVQEVVGFHGRSGWYLDSIGLHSAPAKARTLVQKAEASGTEKSQMVQPWGGNGGTSWDDGTFTGVREIILVYGRCIDSFCVVYDNHGEPFKAAKHGGIGGNKNAEIKLQYPDEFLISVSGHYAPLDARRGGDPYIRSLTFKSNRRTFGPYGVQEGTPFTLSLGPNQQIVGFHGRSGWYLDSLGFHLSHAKSRTLFPKAEASETEKSLVVGPWGGNGGSSWDDGIFTGVRETTLVYDRCIDSIVVVYDKQGKPFRGEKHGGVGGNKTAEIKLQYPNEFLVNVSGHYGPIHAWHGSDPYIRSLTFKSNHRTFGPYGVEEGTPFSFCTDGRQVLGLKGRSGWHLDAIAFYLSHAKSPCEEPKTKLPIGKGPSVGKPRKTRKP